MANINQLQENIGNLHERLEAIKREKLPLRNIDLIETSNPDREIYELVKSIVLEITKVLGTKNGNDIIQRIHRESGSNWAKEICEKHGDEPCAWELQDYVMVRGDPLEKFHFTLLQILQ